MTYRVLVTGSRDWTDRAKVVTALSDIYTRYGDDVCLVHGDCRTGADHMADLIAIAFDWQIERHPTDWGAFGRAAGPKRNEAMVALGAHLCLAFIKNGSRGATHTANLAERTAIPLIRIEEKGNSDD